MKILTKVLLAVAIILAGYLIGVAIATKHEENKVNQRLAEQARQAESKDKTEQAVSQALSAVEDRYSELVIECQKGRAAYDQLPTAIKNRVEVPTCPAIQ